MRIQKSGNFNKKLLKIRIILLIVMISGLYSCEKNENIELPYEKKEIFIDVTKEVALYNIKDSYSHCWGDINGDDFPDILIINHIAPPSLFENNGGNIFKDITTRSGVKIGGDLHGCAIADYDNDGDQDIYITLGAGRGKGEGLNRLYQNRGQEKFKDVALESGVADSRGRGRSASWVDYDNDGFLDLFVANDMRNEAPSVLFKNKQDGTFTVEPGLKIVEHVLETGWVDYNGDGLMDLTISIYKKHLKGEIRIYKNLGDGTFIKKHTFNGRSFAWGDYDNDGDMDLFISNPPHVHILKYEIDILSKFFKGFNKLYENIDGKRFEDVSDKSGLKGQMGGDKPIFCDYDNDGDLDIYLLISGTTNKNINDMIFRNNGDKTFTNVTKAVGLNQGYSGRGCGVAFADYNNDGFLDLFLTNGKVHEPHVPGKEPGPYVLYKNRGNNNHWLKIKLIGTKSNRDGIGSRINLYNRGKMQYRQNNGGMEGYIQNSSLIHYGLGNATVADKIEIIWPSGTVSEMKNVKADQTLTIKENQ
jgi:hypothetical protein